MALPISFFSRTVSDNTVKRNGSPEVTTFRIPIITLTPSNVAATETLCGNLATAIQAVTLGHLIKSVVDYSVTEGEKIPASSNLAQRENKWLFRYHDATTYQKFQVSHGTADLSQLPGDHSEFLDLSTGAGADLKTAFEAVAVSPANSANSVVLDSVQFVGRNT